MLRNLAAVSAHSLVGVRICIGGVSDIHRVPAEAGKSGRAVEGMCHEYVLIIMLLVHNKLC